MQNVFQMLFKKIQCCNDWKRAGEYWHEYEGVFASIFKKMTRLFDSFERQRKRWWS